MQQISSSKFLVFASVKCTLFSLVMQETGCHIHFPDSNRTSSDKSNQVGPLNFLRCIFYVIRASGVRCVHFVDKVSRLDPTSFLLLMIKSVR